MRWELDDQGSSRFGRAAITVRSTAKAFQTAGLPYFGMDGAFLKLPGKWLSVGRCVPAEVINASLAARERK